MGRLLRLTDIRLDDGAYYKRSRVVDGQSIESVYSIKGFAKEPLDGQESISVVVMRSGDRFHCVEPEDRIVALWREALSWMPTVAGTVLSTGSGQRTRASSPRRPGA